MIQGIRLDASFRRNAVEIATKMVPFGDDRRADGTEFAGEVIVEQFGRSELHRGWLRDSDLDPQYRNEHRGSARYVGRRMSPGRRGRFRVTNRGFFVDYHGGMGLRSPDHLNWFTDEAKRRGIGWYFIQTYVHNGQRVARFKVIRIFRVRGTTGTVDVTKLPIR